MKLAFSLMDSLCVLFWFNLTTKVAGAMLWVAGGNPRSPVLSDNPELLDLNFPWDTPPVKIAILTV